MRKKDRLKGSIFRRTTFFLSELRKQFIRVLNLGEDDVIFPKNAQLYATLGGVLLSKDEK